MNSKNSTHKEKIMWFTEDGMIAVELAALIASGWALIGFAIGCVLTEGKIRRVNRIRRGKN